MSVSGLLVRFNVGNFCSINDNQSFSLISGNIKNHEDRLYSAKDFKLLKFASVFGANASGKSNLIKAIQYAVTILLQGTENSFADSNRNNYFRMNPLSKNRNSYFEFEILINDCVYAYGFEISVFEKKIKEEWLIKLGKEENVTIYTRNINDGVSYFNDNYLNSDIARRMNIYLEDYSKVDYKLFLKEVVSNKAELYKNEGKLGILRDIYKWISNVNISYPDTLVTGYDTLSFDNFSDLMKALKSFDTGISKIISHEISKDQAFDKVSYKLRDDVDKTIKLLGRQRSESLLENDNKVLRVNINGNLILISTNGDEIKFKEICFEHFGVSDVKFSLGEESDGTRRLLDLLSVLFAEENSLFIIDELDHSLHPQLTLHFVKTFLRIAKIKNIQLVITTHESRLLNLKLLRRDEIYFIERKENGASVIVPFDRFNERFDKRIDVAYLDGRYGAVPLFDSIYPDYEDVDN
ncbi:ATP/GTP-binding protein [Succinimonas sp.]|uniref:AAA family ATPase n=1 Tax=Succinimonas sp. TaxID=1936151 RepID=UPI002E86AF61|nr:ATP-binding protein [Succinimonas sp.]